MMDPDRDTGGPKHMDPTDPDLIPPSPPVKQGKSPITAVLYLSPLCNQKRSNACGFSVGTT
jgi:hypothetical protein